MRTTPLGNLERPRPRAFEDVLCVFSRGCTFHRTNRLLHLGDRGSGHAQRTHAETDQHCGRGWVCGHLAADRNRGLATSLPAHL
jgi:hypothetical protein